MNASDLRELLGEQIEGIDTSGGDLDGARAAGRRIRRRRRLAVGAAALAVTAVVGGVAVAGIDDSGERGQRQGRDDTEYASLGMLDFSRGVRAYADPGNEIFLGGRSFPADDLEWLDTDAVATEHGIVFFDRGRPMLLDGSGEVTRLVDGPLDPARDFHPTAKADATAPLVAWATRTDGTTTLAVRDMDTGKDVASTDIDCGPCGDLVIDGIDRGTVFVRDRQGTRVWDIASGEWSDFAGPDTRVADVRNGVVLYDGPAPTVPGDWQLVPGAVDAQLTHDGRYVLYWSSRLEPTSRGGEAVELEQGPVGEEPFGWWTIDTDGSVLVATGKDYGDFMVYDCVVPSGECEALGELHPTGGDPMFIGDDM